MGNQEWKKEGKLLWKSPSSCNTEPGNGLFWQRSLCAIQGCSTHGQPEWPCPRRMGCLQYEPGRLHETGSSSGHCSSTATPSNDAKHAAKEGLVRRWLRCLQSAFSGWQHHSKHKQVGTSTTNSGWYSWLQEEEQFGQSDCPLDGKYWTVHRRHSRRPWLGRTLARSHQEERERTRAFDAVRSRIHHGRLYLHQWFSDRTLFVPGLVELAETKKVFIAGDDFKSGQTKFKSVLVDFLVGAGIKPCSIVSYNHLGNNDGRNLSEPQTFRSKEISKSNVVDDMVDSNQVLYGQGLSHPDHTVVIKYVPYVGDSKRAMDEYVSELMLGGSNTIIVHNTCEDSLLATPLILDLAILAELCERITFKVHNHHEERPQFQSFKHHPLNPVIHVQGSSCWERINRCQCIVQTAIMHWEHDASSPFPSSRQLSGHEEQVFRSSCLVWRTEGIGCCVDQQTIRQSIGWSWHCQVAPPQERWKCTSCQRGTEPLGLAFHSKIQPQDPRTRNRDHHQPTASFSVQWEWLVIISLSN